MSIPTEVHGTRTVTQSIGGLTAARFFITTWANRYTDPILPVLNEAHPDFSNLKVTDRIVTQFGGKDGSPTGHANAKAAIEIQYSTQPTGSVSITATTISFADTDPDEIRDSGNGFIDAGFVAGVTITVSGSTSNDGTYTVASVAAGVLVLVGGDSLSTEAAGATVTIVQNNVEVEDNIEMSAQVIVLDADGTRTFVTGGQTVDLPFIQLQPQSVRTKTKILDNFPADTIDALSSHVNSDNFLGRGAGLWLFLGASATSQKDASGDKKWTVVYRFQSNSLGWNTKHNKENTGASASGTTISFSAPGTISDSGGGLGNFIAGSTVTVSGSSLNDGVYFVIASAAGSLTLQATDLLVNEGAGEDITLSQSTFEKITPAPYEFGKFAALGIE